MLHALRAELAYSRPYLLGGLGLAVGVVIIISVVFSAVGENGPPSHAAAGIRGMFLIMAPLIVGFIAQAYRVEERRTRLLLAGHLTPRQIAGVTVLLPTLLFGIGILAAGLMITVGFLVTGRFELESVNIIGFVGGQIFAYTQLGLLAQEATAAHRQRRPRATAAAWLAFVTSVLLLAVLYSALVREVLAWNHLILAHLVIVIFAMVASVALYANRTDFTR